MTMSNAILILRLPLCRIAIRSSYRQQARECQLVEKFVSIETAVHADPSARWPGVRALTRRGAGTLSAIHSHIMLQL